ncbi:hypothetical protein ATANTOWER_023862 [Ataeniobius toweri]|uniref:Uncharacterized protein n=1 Tax=Ataeniobius toweri TaxID=208326 RepID=A0ABU7C0V3_9TELE|nr:hypothetical protein [Ataeniobius toweri]
MGIPTVGDEGVLPPTLFLVKWLNILTFPQRFQSVSSILKQTVCVWCLFPHPRCMCVRVYEVHSFNSFDPHAEEHSGDGEKFNKFIEGLVSGSGTGTGVITRKRRGVQLEEGYIQSLEREVELPSGFQQHF